MWLPVVKNLEGMETLIIIGGRIDHPSDSIIIAYFLIMPVSYYEYEIIKKLSNRPVNILSIWNFVICFKKNWFL